MQRVKRSTAVASLPAPPAGGTPGYFTGGDNQTGTPATVPGYEWYNAVQEEVGYVIEQAGLVLSDADNTQLRQAIQIMIANAQKSIVINNATFAAGVVDGNVVRWDAGAGNFAQAIADGTANQDAVGIADVTNGKVYAYGSCPLFAGLTPGSRYWLSTTAAGAATAAPAAKLVAIGIAKSATEMFVDIDEQLEQTGFTTGDVKLTLKTVADSGWVMANDGTIGNAASGATTRANADTQALFTLLYTNVSDTYAPVSGGRGADATTDFNAGKTITLTKMLGRALAVAGAGSGLTARSLGQTLGEEAHALTGAENGPHTHTVPNVAIGPSGSDNAIDGTSQTASANDGNWGTQTTASSGSGTVHNNMQPTSFLNAMIKL